MTQVPLIMQYTGVFVQKLPSGRGYKAYVWGQTDMHIMDWNGCNYRRITIPDQPLFGFKTPEEAVEFVLNKYETESDVRKWAARAGDGTFLTDEYITNSIDVKWGKK